MADDILAALETQLAEMKQQAEKWSGIAAKSGHDERAKWQDKATEYSQEAQRLEQAIAVRRKEIGTI